MNIRRPSLCPATGGLPKDGTGGDKKGNLARMVARCWLLAAPARSIFVILSIKLDLFLQDGRIMNKIKTLCRVVLPRMLRLLLVLVRACAAHTTIPLCRSSWLAPPFFHRPTPRTDRDLHYRACAAGAAEWCEARLSAAPTLVECDQSPRARKKQKKTRF